MADDVTFQGTTPSYPPTDLVVASDDVGGKKFQRVIPVFGVDGGAKTDVSSFNPLPVTADDLPLPSGAATSANQATVIGHLDGVETLLGTIDADTGSIATSAATLAGAVSGTEMQVDVLTMPTVAVTGTFWQATQPVSLASVPSHAVTNAGTFAVQVDGAALTALQLLDNIVSGSEAQVDIVGALPAGTNAIGKLAANSGVDIGDVDVTSLPAIPAGTNRIGSVTARLDQTRISAAPAISAGSIYASGDAVGGLLTFANAADTSGGTITIQTVVIIDEDQELAPLELVLFDRTFTATSDNAAFDPSDADLANIIGVVKISDYSNFNDNSVAVRTGIGLAAKLNGTDLFGQLVVRSTPTYTATDDITVIVEVVQD